MALLYQPRFRAIDDNGQPMPFAKLYTRDPVAHSTPKVTYSDPDLDVSHQNANPLVADDAGWFGQMYASSDEQFYLILTEADGDPNAPFKVYADVTALGGDAGGSLERTFASARLKITSGEVDTGVSGILIQTGPSSPDDVGGALLMQGQNGTQGDLAVIDFADVNLTGNETVAGDFRVDGDFVIGGQSPYSTLLTSGNVPAALSFVVPLDADYDYYDLIIDGVGTTVLGSSATVSATLSFDGGATYKTAGGSYGGGLNSIDGGSVIDTPNDTDMRLCEAGAILMGSFRLAIFSQAGGETAVSGTSARTLQVSFTVTTATIGAVSRTSGNAKATHIKITTDVAFTKGQYALYGRPGL